MPIAEVMLMFSMRRILPQRHEPRKLNRKRKEQAMRITREELVEALTRLEPWRIPHANLRKLWNGRIVRLVKWSEMSKQKWKG